jgi:hypothetical protein
MPPPDKSDEPAPDKEPAPPQGDAPGAPDPSQEPQGLGILFLAAAVALALLLTIIGLLAAAAMSRMPPHPDEPRAALVSPGSLERVERATPPSA